MEQKKPPLLLSEYFHDTTLVPINTERIIFADLSHDDLADLRSDNALSEWYRADGREAVTFYRKGTTLYVISESGKFELPENGGELFSHIESLEDIGAIEGVDRINADQVQDSINSSILRKNCKRHPLLTTELLHDPKIVPPTTGHIVFTDIDSLPVKLLFSQGCGQWYQSGNDEKLLVCRETASDAVYIASPSGRFSLPENASALFKDFNEVMSIHGLDRIDTSNVTDMRDMFLHCTALSGLDLSAWDTSRVTNMSSMFATCFYLKDLNVETWNTSRVTDMSDMFCGCMSLAKADVSGWNTNQVCAMTAMFSGCISLSDLDLSGWDTGNVTNMERMFDGCKSLETLRMPAASTAKAPNTKDLFAGCTSLKTVELPRHPMAARSIKIAAKAQIEMNQNRSRETPEKVR